jgi:hypothetical protein
MNHRDHDERSHVLHRLAAERLRNDPRFFAECVERIRRWRKTCSPRAMPYLDGWQAAFDGGVERVCEIAIGQSEWCDAMRQCSPMVFIYNTVQEKRWFLRHWREIKAAQEKGETGKTLAEAITGRVAESRNKHERGFQAMTWSLLEHLVGAAAAVIDEELIVVGSQAILGEHPDAPKELLFSGSVDLLPASGDPRKSEILNEALGEFSFFRNNFGCYAKGVETSALTLPEGWRGRLARIRNTDKACGGGCLETHDLAVSKLIAGRVEDFEFVSALLRHEMIDLALIRERLATVDQDEQKMLALLDRREIISYRTTQKDVNVFLLASHLGVLPL